MPKYFLANVQANIQESSVTAYRVFEHKKRAGPYERLCLCQTAIRSGERRIDLAGSKCKANQPRSVAGRFFFLE